jgi:methyltransferase (TIGR00027 family)
MKAAKASRTSDNAAAMRAMHLIRHGEPKIFEDSYAIRLTSPFWRAVTENRLLYWLFTRDFLYGWIHPVIGDLVARARYAEEQLESAIREGVSQYVLLGAGMDSFALRRSDLAGSVAIFEIDHPATQQLKKERLGEIGITLPKSHFFLPVDFEQESLAEALSKSSFSAEVPAFFSWLGSVVYIEKSAVLQTLGDLASCAARGSKIVFTYCDAQPLEGKSSSETFRSLLKATQRRGEPMITGFHEEELWEELHRLGFEVVETLSSDEIQRRYFWGRTDGLTMLDHIHFICARVVRAERAAVAL